MPTKAKVPPKPCPFPLDQWVHTHTIAEIPVMRVNGAHLSGPGSFPTHWSKTGEQINNLRGKAIPVVQSSAHEEPETRPLPAPPPSPIEPLTPAEPPAIEEVLPETTVPTVRLHVEVARAALHAAAWPVYGESHGHAQGSRGESADLQGQLPDGSWKVRICDPRLPGGFVWVRVPEEIEFEVVEGDS